MALESSRNKSRQKIATRYLQAWEVGFVLSFLAKKE
jgi:hypothetical protein